MFSLLFLRGEVFRTWLAERLGGVDLSDDNTPHIFSLLVSDEPGVMQKVSMIFARRAINIESINVGKASEPGRARIILVFRSDLKKAVFLKAYLGKLVQVKEVEEIDYEASILRELALIKVRFPGEADKLRTMRQIDQFGARILYVGINYLIVEVSGGSDRVQQFIENLDPNLKIEVIRSGLAAIQP